MIISDTQKTFDTMVDHLYKQGGPAINDIGGCLYRGPNGSKCAIGCLIPDEEYKDSMEGKSVNYLNIDFDNLKTKSVCYSMQIVHDEFSLFNSTWTQYLNEKIAMVAFNNELEFTPR